MENVSSSKFPWVGEETIFSANLLKKVPPIFSREVLIWKGIEKIKVDKDWASSSVAKCIFLQCFRQTKF